MANGLPRSELRKGWAVPEHLAALDDDQDKLQAAMTEGFQKIADQLEKNRRTWQWGVGIFIAFATLVCAVIGLIVSTSGG